MAIAKKAAKKVTKTAAKKAAPAPSAAKPKAIKAALNKTGLIAHVATTSGVDAKIVRKVIAGIEDTIVASVSKKGAGAFVLPGFLKVTVVKVPAKPKRKGINRFTGLEQVFAAKPASQKVKVRPLKKLKDAAV